MMMRAALWFVLCTLTFVVSAEELSRLVKREDSLTALNERLSDVEIASEKLVKSIDGEIDDLETKVIGSVNGTMDEFAEKFLKGNNAVIAAKNGIGKEFNGVKETIDGIIRDMKTELAKDIQDKVDGYTGSVKDSAEAITASTTGLASSLEETQKCRADGMAWDRDGKKCVPVQVQFAESTTSKCDVDNIGLTRYKKALNGLEVCTSSGWTNVAADGECTAKYGEGPCNPAVSCRALGWMNMIPEKGKKFWIGDLKYASVWTCKLDRHWAYGNDKVTFGGISYGDGSDGDLVLPSGRHYINALFPGYNPRTHRIPQWNTVTLKSGAFLGVAPYDDTGDESGGILAFRVKGKLTMESNSQLNVDYMGHRGGLAAGWYAPSGTFMEPTGYGSESRSADGTGDGGGYGGKGGYGCCHGDGGGGASFGRKGQNGEPDKCRNSRGGWNQGFDHDQTYTPPGAEYNFKSSLYHPFEVMGSGGGAGGGGHASMSNSPPQNGGCGGGTIQIMVGTMTMAGNMYARGECGLPCRTYRSWPNGNTQAAGGGGGSGGLIKVISKDASNHGKTDRGGGRQSYNNGWCRSDHQRGGKGGEGRVVHTKNQKEI